MYNLDQALGGVQQLNDSRGERTEFSISSSDTEKITTTKPTPA
jgi:hypothetical protein